MKNVGLAAKSARIVGGNTLPPNEDAIPWQVALLNRDDGLVICGGALLSNSFILSAAHCRLRLHLNGIGTDKVLIGAKSVTETDKLYILSHIYHIHPEYERYDDPRIRPSIYDLIIFIQFCRMYDTTLFIGVAFIDNIMRYYWSGVGFFG